MHSIREVIRHFKQNWTEGISETAGVWAYWKSDMNWNDSKFNPFALTRRGGVPLGRAGVCGLLAVFHTVAPGKMR